MPNASGLLRFAKALWTCLRSHVLIDDDHCIDAGKVAGERMGLGVRPHQNDWAPALLLDQLVVLMSRLSLTFKAVLIYMTILAIFDLAR